MSTITVIDNEHVQLYYHTDTKIVHHVYQPTIGGKYLREQLTKGVELLKEHDAHKWLSDNHLFNSLPDEDNKWINDVWLPQAIEAGWRFWALVVPKEDLGRMNMIQFVNSFAQMGVFVRVFVDPDEAMDWLVQVSEETVKQ
jgi:hypothetical protein